MKKILAVAAAFGFLASHGFATDAQGIPGPEGLNDQAKKFQQKALTGDPGATYDLGVLYMQGSQGGPADPVIAVQLWEKAAAAGYAPALYNLGSAYYNGDGVEKDDAKARDYYTRALEAYKPLAAQGDANAQKLVPYLTRMLSQPSNPAAGG